MTGTLAAIAGAAVVGGVLLMLAGLSRAGADRSRRRRARSLWALGGRDSAAVLGVPQWWARWRWVVAAGTTVAVWLVTGWPVAGLICAATVVGVPMLWTSPRKAAAGIARLEALEEWTRRLGDVLAVGIGLEQAVAATVRNCPEVIRPAIAAAAARLTARWPTEAALRALADDLDDATADLVVATLILGARRRGPGLARVLTGLAEDVAQEVVMRRKVEAERARPRTTARLVTLITLAVVAVGALNGTYLRPYGTTLGQLVLAAIAVAFVACLAWMHAMTGGVREPRFLNAQPHAATAGSDDRARPVPAGGGPR